MSLTQSAERAALNKLIDYLDDNPQENIDKIMDLVNKLVPNRVFPVQREAFTNVIKSRGNWYDLIMRVFSLNPQMRTKLLKTLIVDANLLAWPEQEKNREKYQCNVPWAILLDPTSACNLHCTGCWAAEYGYKQNLSFDDIDSIVTQGKELGTHIYIYTGGEPLVRKHDLIRICEKHQDCVFLCFTNSTLIDEAFCDMTGTSSLYGNPVDFAHRLKDEIHTRLGFTVNIGISSNRLLAKTASDFEKPDKVHTLFPSEMEEKFWPLPIEDLFFVGKSTALRLRSLGITTIGQLAKSDHAMILSVFKSHGDTIWNYANGIESTPLSHNDAASKGFGNSLTLQYDVTDAAVAKHVLLSLCETVGARIRAAGAYVSVVQVQIVDNDFRHTSRQVTLASSTNVTEKLYTCACELFDELWDHRPIRLLGVSTGKATQEHYEQYDLFDMQKNEKLSRLNVAVDAIRSRYGEDSIKRACFIEADDAAPALSHMTGGMQRAKRNAAHPADAASDPARPRNRQP